MVALRAAALCAFFWYPRATQTVLDAWIWTRASAFNVFHSFLSSTIQTVLVTHALVEQNKIFWSLYQFLLWIDGREEVLNIVDTYRLSYLTFSGEVSLVSLLFVCLFGGDFFYFLILLISFSRIKNNRVLEHYLLFQATLTVTCSNMGWNFPSIFHLTFCAFWTPFCCLIFYFNAIISF